MEENVRELLVLAEGGDMAAQEKAGTLFFKGNGVEKDIAKALEYYSLAAQNGSGLGNYQMGRAYETGTGSPLDIEKAKWFYEKSAALGYQNAVNKLESLKQPARNVVQTAIPVVATPTNTYTPPKAPTLSANKNTSMGVQKSKTTAVLLALFLGAFGAHNFYLGFKKKAIIQLILTLVVIGSPFSAIWAFVEFIMILTGSIPNDANGIRLK